MHCLMSKTGSVYARMIGSSFSDEGDRITAQNAAKTQPPSGGIARESVGIVAISMGVVRVAFTLNEGDTFASIAFYNVPRDEA